MKHIFLTVSQAAKLKGVSRTTIYTAIEQKRLPHRTLLGHIVVKEADVLALTPAATPRGRPKGKPITDEHRSAIAKAQKERWAQRKAAPIGESKSQRVEFQRSKKAR
jgi:excisionase family DNA binding protein